MALSSVLFLHLSFLDKSKSYTVAVYTVSLSFKVELRFNKKSIFKKQFQWLKKYAALKKEIVNCVFILYLIPTNNIYFILIFR